MSSKPKELAQRIMDVQAVYCNDVQFAMTNLGLRLTFGEASIVEGEPPSHRVAVFLPVQVADAFFKGFQNVREEHAAKQAKNN